MVVSWTVGARRACAQWAAKMAGFRCAVARATPLKGRGLQLMYIARRHHSITEGESEVKGVFGMAHRDSKWEAMPCSIPAARCRLRRCQRFRHECPVA